MHETAQAASGCRRREAQPVPRHRNRVRQEVCLFVREEGGVMPVEKGGVSTFGGSTCNGGTRMFMEGGSLVRLGTSRMDAAGVSSRFCESSGLKFPGLSAGRQVRPRGGQRRKTPPVGLCRAPRRKTGEKCQRAVNPCRRRYACRRGKLGRNHQ